MADAKDEKQALIAKVSGLERSIFEITSAQTDDYNYIAWAAHDTARWWWPGGYWPTGISDAERLDAFEAAFATLGFTPCDSAALQPGYKKVAIYTRDGSPDGARTHAARQLADGTWTSKLGSLEDIRHPLDAPLVTDYGQPVRFLRRPRT